MSQNRPIGVWIFSAFYGFSALFAIVGWLVVLSDTIPLDSPEREYYQSLTALDYLVTFVLAGLGLSLFLGPGQKGTPELEARIMHRFSSRSAESTVLARRATKAPASVLYSTLRRPIERNTVRTSDFRDAVENLCIIRARERSAMAW